MGEVKQPGSLQFTGSMTLIEALARAGSMTEHAGTDVVIVRSSNASDQRLQLKIQTPLVTAPSA